MSKPFTAKERKIFKNYHHHAKLLIQKLTKMKKINPHHIEDMTSLHELLIYTNKMFEGSNKWDLVTRDPQVKEEFILTNKKYEFTNENIDEYWFSFMILVILRHYWLLESSLIILLKGVKYGTKPKEKINGRETLGNFKKDVFPKLGLTEHIDWSVIDTNFRNSIAHGWYKTEKNILVYYKNVKLEDPKCLTQIEMIRKLRVFYLHALAMVGEIGNWNELKDFGDNDPLTNG